MQRFRLHRFIDDTGYSGTGDVAEGVVFSSGKVCIQWKRDIKSIGIYDSIEDLLKVHGHGGKTVVEFIDRHSRGYIYQIRNVITGAVYIGKTRNLRDRKQYHFQKLKIGKHPNRLLQLAHTIHPENTLVFEVLQNGLFGDKELSTLERFYTQLNNGKLYNRNAIDVTHKITRTKDP